MRVLMHANIEPCVREGFDYTFCDLFSFFRAHLLFWVRPAGFANRGGDYCVHLMCISHWLSLRAAPSDETAALPIGSIGRRVRAGTVGISIAGFSRRYRDAAVLHVACESRVRSGTFLSSAYYGGTQRTLVEGGWRMGKQR